MHSDAGQFDGVSESNPGEFSYPIAAVIGDNCDISLKIDPERTELLFLPDKGSPTHDLTTTFQTPTARNFGVTLDSQLP